MFVSYFGEAVVGQSFRTRGCCGWCMWRGVCSRTPGVPNKEFLIFLPFFACRTLCDWLLSEKGCCCKEVRLYTTPPPRTSCLSSRWISFFFFFKRVFPVNHIVVPDTRHDHRLVSVGCFALPNPFYPSPPLASIGHRPSSFFPRAITIRPNVEAASDLDSDGICNIAAWTTSGQSAVYYARPYFGLTLVQYEPITTTKQIVHFRTASSLPYPALPCPLRVCMLILVTPY